MCAYELQKVIGSGSCRTLQQLVRSMRQMVGFKQILMGSLLQNLIFHNCYMDIHVHEDEKKE